MKWFQGSIAEAVASSKLKSAVFVVFVEGHDSNSTGTTASIENPEVLSHLESNDFVAIKLGSGTEEYKQFTEIYRIVPVPSLFFIGSDGRPIEIVAGLATPSEILKRISAVRSKTPTLSKIQVPGASMQGASTPVTTYSVAETITTNSLATNAIEKAKESIENARKLKLEEEKVKQRVKEEERRRVGQEVQQLRRWQQDQEMKQLKEEREKEKREEKAARERVREQIAQDKAQRSKANTIEKLKPEVEVAVPKVASNSDLARLQLRMPNGSAVFTQLNATDHLRQLRLFVSTHLNQPSRNFVLSTSFPRRPLLESEDDKTMSELELTPSAVILVLASSSTSLGLNEGASGRGIVAPIQSMVMTLVSPVIAVLNYLRSIIFGGGSDNNQTISSTAGQTASQNRKLPSKTEESKAVKSQSNFAATRRQGNIHRLNQQDSSDDENKTWNGNSTQQQ